MKRRKNKLTNIKVEEVSLVDKGANPGANVLLFKRDNMEDKNQGQEPEIKEAEVVVQDTASEEVKNAEVTEVAPTEEDKTEDTQVEGEGAQELDDVEKSANAFEVSLAASESLDDMWELQNALREALKLIAISDKENKYEAMAEVLDAYLQAVKAKVTIAFTGVVKSEELSLVSELDKEVSKYYMALGADAKSEVLASENPVEELNKRASEDQVIAEEGNLILKSAIGETAFTMIKKAQAEKAEAEAKLQEEINKRKEEEVIAKASELLKDYPLEDKEKATIYKAFSAMDGDAKDSLEKLFSAGKTAFQGLVEQKALPVEKTQAVDKTDQEKVIDIIKNNKKDK